jgi:hypothetical protein
MFRKILKNLSDSEREAFCSLVGSSWGTVSVKYMSETPLNRRLPRRDRFETLLSAINTIRPGSISREQLAVYFYAAPAGQDGQETDAA